MMKGVLSSAVICLAVFAFAGTASAASPTKAELAQLLSGYEDMPPATAWRAWGPETLAVLVELYDDSDQQPFIRMRAVSAVAHYPSPAARTFLLAVARAPRQTDLFVREAVVSLARAFGARAVDDVRPFLRHREPVVREGAVVALARIRTPEALSALRTRLPDERTEHVAERIRRSLASTQPR